MKELELSSIRIARFCVALRREYDAASIVKEFLPIRLAQEGEGGRFERIGQRFHSDGKPFVAASRSGGTPYAPEILGVGHSIAIGEDRYIIKQLQKQFNLHMVQTRDEMLTFLTQDRGLGLEFTAAFVPLKYYQNLHDPRNPSLNVFYVGRKPHLRIREQTVRVFWSNKYNPFESFFFVTKSSMEWRLKKDPDSGHAVRISVELEKKSGKVIVSAQTIAFLNILHAERGFAFTLKEEPLE
jgi:hypothetical protein